MNRRTFIVGGAAVATLATATTASALVAQTIGLPRLEFYSGALPMSAQVALSPGERETITQFGRVLETRSAALVTVDRGSREAIVRSSTGTRATLPDVWDLAEFTDGTLLVSTMKQGLLRTTPDLKPLKILLPHDDRQTLTRVAVSDDQWVAYDPSQGRILTSLRRPWPTLDRLGLSSVRDIIGLTDGRFIVADPVAASVFITDGYFSQTLASYRDHHGDPVAPMALLKTRAGLIWVRTSALAMTQVRGFA